MHWLHSAHPACSREGAAIGAALVALIQIALAVTLLVLLVALVSGVVVGVKRGAVGKQVARHLAWAVLALIALPPLSYGVWIAHQAVVDQRVRRDEAEFARWLQPFDDVRPGGLGAALDRVIADSGDGPGRIGYLVLWLQQKFDTIGWQPSETDRALLATLPERLERELAARHAHTHPSNLRALQGAAEWLRLRPDLAAAAAGCAGEDSCLNRLGEAWGQWCRRDATRCQTATPAEALDALAATYADHFHFRSVLLGTRQAWSRKPDRV